MPFTNVDSFQVANNFQAKVKLEINRGRYLIKTASTAQELFESLQLRHEVFYREILNREAPHGLDIDQFDMLCDHLLIIDTETNKIAGSYRLNCSLFTDSFYSSQEFNVENITRLAGPKVELGRACIDKNYRNGTVITLLWRGVMDFMLKTDSHLLFGCASIKTEDVREAAMIYRYFLNEGRFNQAFHCPPLESWRLKDFEKSMAEFNRSLTEEETSHIEDLIPSLCKSYLKAGAFLGGEPAFDADFKCIDFLTILSMDNLHPKLRSNLVRE